MSIIRSFLILALPTVLLGACGPVSPSARPSPSPAPVTQADLAHCASLTWIDVRTALETVDHYTYQRIDHFTLSQSNASAAPTGPQAIDRTAVGTYQAPDQLSEISTWKPLGQALSHSTWGLLPAQYPDFIQVGTQRWEQIPLSGPRWVAISTGLVAKGQGGYLLGLLNNLAASAPWSSARAVPDASTQCLLTDNSPPGAAGRTHFAVSLWADPVTKLPTRLQINRVEQAGGISRSEITVDSAAPATPIAPPASSVPGPSAPPQPPFRPSPTPALIPRSPLPSSLGPGASVAPSPAARPIGSATPGTSVKP